MIYLKVDDLGDEYMKELGSRYVAGVVMGWDAIKSEASLRDFRRRRRRIRARRALSNQSLA